MSLDFESESLLLYLKSAPAFPVLLTDQGELFTVRSSQKPASLVSEFAMQSRRGSPSQL